MKTNKEIIIEELKKVLSDFGVPLSKIKHHSFGGFVSSLLSKLNKLDRDNLKKLFYKFTTIDNRRDLLRDLNNKKVQEELIDQILSLIPEEGEVVAEGYGGEFTGMRVDIPDKYEDKKIQIIIREVK
jgi:hypothetical protein